MKHLTSNVIELYHSSNVADYWKQDNGVIIQRYHTNKQHNGGHTLYLSNDEVGQALLKSLRKAGIVEYNLYRCPSVGKYSRTSYTALGHVKKAIGKVIYVKLK